MRLTTVRRSDGSTNAGRVEGDEIVLLPFTDVGGLLATGDDWQRSAAKDGPRIAMEGAAIGRLIERPSKIICLSANYAEHVREFNPEMELPRFPDVFTKFAESLTGPYEDIPLLPGPGFSSYQAAIEASAGLPVLAQPPTADCVDWEAELVVVVGRTVRRASEAEAIAAIGGFTVGNDVSARDWQSRASQFLPGKSWEGMSPVGPALVTPDELGGARPDLPIRCLIDGVVMQDSRTGSPVFDPVEVVSYISRFVTLRRGDLIFMGSVPGIGVSKDPQLYIHPGQVMTTEIEGIGQMVNNFVIEDLAPEGTRQVAAAGSGRVSRGS